MIRSGAQTGVDRAALDAALERAFPLGGWVPKGRRAEDGIIPAHYPLEETPTEEYQVRTEWNVRDSDATLIITQGVVSGGTALTVEFAKAHQKPYLIIDLKDDTLCRDQERVVSLVKEWIDHNGPRVLNIAGPRESKHPGIYNEAKDLIRKILKAVLEQR